MRQKSSDNLWYASSGEDFTAEALTVDRSVDLVIIGGGFTGAAAALEAARRGADVCLLEAETIGHGGSGRNVGLVNAGLWLPPEEILAILGAAAGRRLIDALSVAPERVFSLIDQAAINCEAVRKGTLHCAHAPSGLRDLENRLRQGRAIGAPLDLLDSGEAARRTGSPAFLGALLDLRCGTIQPLAYARGLARAARTAGAHIHELSPVSTITRQDDGWRVSCNGHDIRARALLVATNAYHLGIAAPVRPQFVPIHYSQFATQPLGEAERARILAGGEGCWDTALVMSSFRLDRAGRLILGGMGNVEGAGRSIHQAWARRKLRALFPALADQPFTHQWSGRIAMTGDHIPKLVHFGENALACFGYSGRGIGPGTVFGTACAGALLEGRTDSLPVAPIENHTERFAGARAAYYELGATLAHGVMKAR